MLMFIVQQKRQNFAAQERTTDTTTKTSAARGPSAVFESVILKKRGSDDSNNDESWKLIEWNNDSTFTPSEHQKFKCDFTTFTSSSTGISAPMCVHAFRDYVSGSIRRKKRWTDCDLLPVLWNASHVNQTDQSVYVEIGANIGSCVMEMLLGTNATIVAFEPHPMNLFNLKKTVVGLDQKYQDRLRLFPIGLGDAKATNTIYSADNNMGNSVIGKVIKDTPTQAFSEALQFEIYVEKMSDILSSDADVKLMKIDAQGFECKILDGWSEDTAGSIETIKMEYADHWLEGQGCMDLVPKFIRYGFDVFHGHNGGLNFGNQYFENPSRKNAVMDIFAKNKNPKQNKKN
eukprot:CAMPEP_0198300394 /NCGR_PEP_ID=MMETSP1449-20131203/48060_1 /TAXON_ID=420275 /ORGANISM="Attheya septentrionalis, Strain CCMP2084" /LENGTH=344 /DNA_ID=CAMNT_0044002217 /DNA_START=193 /DNA_END=1227 /DNA_ORIENTATION=-